MSEPTVVALAILVVVFLIMALTIAKEGADKAIKMWGVMGALTGVAFGAIISYYFTDQTYKARVARLQAEVETSQFAFERALQQTDSVQASMNEYAIALSGADPSWNGDPSVVNLANSLDQTQRDLLVNRFKEFSSELLTIEDLKKTPREKK